VNDNSVGNALWAVFLEATDGVQRVQWMLFPPCRAEHGAAWAEGQGRFIKRRLEKAGHRAKWKTITKPSAAAAELKLKSELEQYESTGWVLKQPILIVLEEDDYLKAWAGAETSTPYKALRHVEKVAMQRGYRLTS
jgi:hypothetical protein